MPQVADILRPPPLGGVLKEFTEAAQDALAEANRIKLTHPAPSYNIYLDRALHLVGIDAPLEEGRTKRRRKAAFTHGPTVKWAISFFVESKRALVEHRSGYICGFQKA